MKSFFKKSVISMFVMGVAGTSFASHGYVSQAWSPHYTGFFIGVEGLDLRPENGDLDYITVFPISGSAGSFNTASVSNGYQWGWRLFGGIKFTDNDDITLSWMHLNADNSDSTTVASDFTSFPRGLFPDSDWVSASGKLKTEFTDIYGVLGHTIHFNNPWDVRFAAGFEYTKLDSDLSVSASSTDGFDNGAGFTGNSHFKGFGPRVDFDATYHLPYNFALFAEANAALLASTRKISLNGTSTTFEGETSVFHSAFFSTRHVIVPKFGTRLGASYTWIFGQAGGEGAALSALKVDAGWHVESYVHAIERVTILETKTSNYGDQGLFIGLEYSSGAI